MTVSFAGLKRRTVFLSDKIVQLEFLEGTVGSQQCSPMLHTSPSYVLVRTAHGRVLVVDCQLGSDSPPSDVSVQ